MPLQITTRISNEVPFAHLRKSIGLKSKQTFQLTGTKDHSVAIYQLVSDKHHCNWVLPLQCFRRDLEVFHHLPQSKPFGNKHLWKRHRIKT